MTRQMLQSMLKQNRKNASVNDITAQASKGQLKNVKTWKNYKTLNCGETDFALPERYPNNVSWTIQEAVSEKGF